MVPAGVMMTHSPEAWEHVQFKDVAVKVSSSEVRGTWLVWGHCACRPPAAGLPVIQPVAASCLVSGSRPVARVLEVAVLFSMRV